MKQSRDLMGMPIMVEIVDESTTEAAIDKIFSYFEYIDEKFSTYKDESEITKINNHQIKESDWSEDMKTIFSLSEKTKNETNGYFDIKKPDGKYDPSGIVKGWAIWNAVKILKAMGFKNFFIEAGGDIEVSGKNDQGEKWKIGIRNPFNKEEIIKVVHLSDEAIATSGTYERGQHIYNPKEKSKPITDIVSLSVIGPNIYEADRFATAAFAMGKIAINFIESLNNFEGYMIDKNGMAIMTSGFNKYTD